MSSTDTRHTTYQSGEQVVFSVVVVDVAKSPVFQDIFYIYKDNFYVL
jgi:hypothetical protein